MVVFLFQNILQKNPQQHELCNIARFLIFSKLQKNFF